MQTLGSNVAQDIERFKIDWAFLKPELPWLQYKVLSRWSYTRDMLKLKVRSNDVSLRKWKLQRLGELVDWAFTSVPFYRDLYKEIGYSVGEIRSYDDFTRLPIISREHLPFVGDLNSYHLSSHLLHDELRGLETTGSTGKPVQIMMDQSLTEIDTIHRMNMFEEMSGNQLNPKEWIYNINHAHWWHTNLCGFYRVFTVSQRCPIESIKQHIQLLRPKFISSIFSAAEKLADSNIDLVGLGVTCLSTNSETSTRTQRDKLEVSLNVKVRDEYSSEEVGLMAYECTEGNYHFLEHDTHIELITDSDSDLGRIVGTSLWNMAMPIIRYDQGDFGQWHGQTAGSNNGWAGEKCCCGSSYRRIKAIHGRIDDAFISISNRLVPSGMMLEIAEKWLSHDDAGIIEFRVIQEEVNKIRILTIWKSGTPSNKAMQCIKNFTNEMCYLFHSKIDIELVTVDHIPPLNKLKRRIFFNNIKKQLNF
ncbi:phenylacetate-CoA ligase [Candidatus Bartonella washoeensis]|uniref:AMP-dependent ligase C-terminal domain-containing protein n=1 Tax=Candidatus Bartonella washoeensis Sb944nv TaxID=1094563 RepID=J1J2M4_9HYPH|nr:phenylacetate--CoA ligase family protein [Bartonella washoeensis]EJF77885.1 hypothetical protein MCQ_01328 [Bartonella washoeensis Sb944nv]SPU27546.1 phenylacetate-CoA ligase [Bartonella washoeensis]